MTKKELKQKLNKKANLFAPQLKARAELEVASYEAVALAKREVEAKVKYIGWRGYSITAAEVKNFTSFEAIKKHIENNLEKNNRNFSWKSLSVIFNEKEGVMRKLSENYSYSNSLPKWYSTIIEEKQNEKLLEIGGVRLSQFKYVSQGGRYSRGGVINFPKYSKVNTKRVNIQEKNELVKKARALREEGQTIDIAVKEHVQSRYEERHTRINERTFYVTIINWSKWAFKIVKEEFKNENNIVTGKQLSTRERDKASRENQYRRFYYEDAKTPEEKEEKRRYDLIERMISIKRRHDQEMTQVVKDLFNDDEKVTFTNASVKSEIEFKLIKALNRVRNGEVK